jgi:hypothetical protein
MSNKPNQPGDILKDQKEQGIQTQVILRNEQMIMSLNLRHVSEKFPSIFMAITPPSFQFSWEIIEWQML